ncbi:M23 family metallopeptidase [Akkermansia sp. N21169]|uniref:M23 family metallopeptidase n=1 Tax=Akkermansia sp. N21169 TaxID=3040765 RepID=UPI00244EC1BD|nr:M23 family metallopeptidase [Akkermansia sp. N21169]MDH3068666.1 M23 family metallopeptidase [Akkermansia sp. N21169]
MASFRNILAGISITIAASCMAVPAHAILLRLPTANDALFRNKPEDFFMYVDRTFEGVKSKPWEGGQYGFTRTLVRTQAGPVATKFHEGIDIKPLKRDATGAPLDMVHPVAGGRVVHVSDNPRDSSYGRYVVIEHTLPDGPLYSLYAHLASTNCKPGDVVGTGNTIGKLGYSGVGINKERAHVHLELCLLLNRNFQKWYDGRKLGTPNKHGIFNGLNLSGFNPVDALMICKDGTPFNLSQYISGLPPQYTVRVPNAGTPDMVKRYPFLLKQGSSNPASWEIALTDSGVPVSFTPSAEPCAEPIVISAVPHPFSQLYRTVNRVKGSSKAPILTPSGKSYIKLLTMSAPENSSDN